MIEVNEPQIWTLIGIFAASMFGMLRMTSTSFVNILRAEIGGVRAEIGGLRGEVNSRIGGVHGEIGGLRAEMNARFDQLNGRMDHLDRGVQMLFRRVFPEYPEAN